MIHECFGQSETGTPEKAHHAQNILVKIARLLRILHPSGLQHPFDYPDDCRDNGKSQVHGFRKDHRKHPDHRVELFNQLMVFVQFTWHAFTLKNVNDKNLLHPLQLCNQKGLSVNLFQLIKAQVMLWQYFGGGRTNVEEVNRSAPHGQ